MLADLGGALELDPGNVELRRELAYLLLKLGNEPEAVQEFEYVTRTASDDLLSATQLGFLLLAHGGSAAAMTLFKRVSPGRVRT